VTVSNSGGTSTATFNGTAGQRIALNLGSVTITSSKISILKPGGTNLVTPFTVTRTGFFFDAHTLPTTGSYKIVVDPKDTYTGRVVLTLYDVPLDTTGPITADGTLATVATATPGQNATLTFSGTAGQRISASLTGVTYSSAKLRILNPDSTLLYPTALPFGPAGGFLEPKTLPATGPYTLVVDPQLRATGAANVQLYTVPNDPTTVATVGGAAVPATATVPGQNAYVTFSATLNQRVSVKLTDSTYGSAKVTWRKPDGTALFSPSLAISPLGTFLIPRTLTTAGTYTLFIDPQFADTGSVNVQVFNVPPDLSGAITPGTPLHVAIDNPGQNALYTFTGTAGQRLSLDVQNVTFEKAAVSVLKPDGTLLYSPATTVMSGGTGFHEPNPLLPVGGTYKVKVDPVDGTTGALDVGLYVGFTDVSTTIVSNATPVTITTTVPGQNAKLTFAGTTAQRVSLKLTGVTMASAKVTLYKPDGVTKLGVTRTVGPTGDFIDTQSLTTTGTYKIVVDPVGNATGSMTLTLYLVPADVSAPITANGSATPVAVGTPGQNAALTFSASANQRVFLKVTGSTTATPAKVSLQRAGTNPIQYVFFTQSVNTDPFYFDTKSVGTTAGSFKIVFDPQSADTGGATFRLWTVPADVTGALTPGSNSVTIGNVGQEARVTFAGTAGQTATLTWSSGTIAEARVRLYSTNGTTQLSSAYWVSSFSSNDTVEKLLPLTGTYTFWIDPTNEFTGSETFTLTLS
jgi:hypothetical protein